MKDKASLRDQAIREPWLTVGMQNAARKFSIPAQKSVEEVVLDEDRKMRIPWDPKVSLATREGMASPTIGCQPSC